MCKRSAALCNIVTLLVLAGALPDRVALSGTDDRPAWSAPVDGLRTRFVSDRSVYEQGQYIWLWLDVLNTTDEPVQMAWGSALENRLRLVDGKGQQVTRTPRAWNELPGHVGVRAVAAGKHVELMMFYICGNEYGAYPPLKPGRYRALWTTKLGESVKGGRLAPSSAVTFEVVPRKVLPPVPDGQAKDVPWGEAEGGLQTRIRADRNRYYAGDPIPITVEVRNVSDETLRYFLPQVAINGRITVKDAQSRDVPYIHGTAQTSNPLMSLEPGKTAVLDAQDLAEYHFLREPGKYTAHWPGRRARERPDRPGRKKKRPKDSSLPPTNTFHFEVLPSDRVDPFDQALGLLIEKCPKDWHVESGPRFTRLGRPGTQRSRVPCHQYRFVHKDRFRCGLLDRLQIRTITIWIAREKAAEEPWDVDEYGQKRKTEYLGQGKHGHIYVEPIHESPLKHWPSAIADIMKWLGVAA